MWRGVSDWCLTFLQLVFWLCRDKCMKMWQILFVSISICALRNTVMWFKNILSNPTRYTCAIRLSEFYFQFLYLISQWWVALLQSQRQRVINAVPFILHCVNDAPSKLTCWSGVEWYGIKIDSRSAVAMSHQETVCSVPCQAERKLPRSSLWGWRNWGSNC
jgi:hypothetical protein